MFQAEVSMSPGLLDSTDVLGAPNFGAQTNEAKQAQRRCGAGSTFFFGNLSWISTDAKILCKLRQRKAFETEGAFHFVGISAPTRRIDALLMGFCSIFGGFFAIGFWCVGRTCINFMWQMVSGKDW